MKCVSTLLLCVVAAFAIIMSVVTSAQVPTSAKAVDATPVISELEAAKLDKLILLIENLNLKITQMQSELSKVQAEAQTFAKTLTRPGYALTRTVSGEWAYAKNDTPASTEKK